MPYIEWGVVSKIRVRGDEKRLRKTLQPLVLHPMVLHLPPSLWGVLWMMGHLILRAVVITFLSLQPPPHPAAPVS